MMANLTMSENQMFCFTILWVFLEMSIALMILEGLSSMMTMSAASTAASEPRLPMATPTSALASEGASLMPSPTNMVDPSEFSRIFSSSAVLPAGRSPAL